MNHDRYMVRVEQYVAFRHDGYLVVPQLLPPTDIVELRRHTEDLMLGRLPEQAGAVMPDRDLKQDFGVLIQPLAAPPEHLSPHDKAQYWLRIHMLHRRLPLHERYLLHPRLLDVLEVLIGPDVLALQSMLFLKPPGKPGQGWHQDSYYIPTHPDTLCGAWIAIDDCDQENGAMWFARGSGHEPVYPPCPEIDYGFGDRLISGIQHIRGASDEDDTRNMLAPIATRYEQVLCACSAGDVVFFNGHVLHCSRANRSRDRLRRAFVGHYCNARSFTQWGADHDDGIHAAEKIDPVTKMTNASHILARGDTHLPFARPRFGTSCAAMLPEQERCRASSETARRIAAVGNGLLGCALAEPNLRDDDDAEMKSPYG